ncbi:MAG: NAD(P)H-hydrate dehydratase [Elusimicrobiota bacterium]|jgi:NAD(P)H-hydrate epimerase|nr:NAD(P)H-hydrate dehydratase [Elusimicrobiota bacterium]
MAKITKDFFKMNYPLRSKYSYKTLNGKVLIVAGSKNMPGAAILAALSCYKSGVGLVSLAVPKEIAQAVALAVPEALILTLPSTSGSLNKAALKQIIKYQKTNPHDVVLIGPGLSSGAKITLELLNKINLPAVIDADALNFIAKDGAGKLKDLTKKFPCILTPHQGEMKRLLKTNTLPKNSYEQLSKITGAVALLKGPKTKVFYNGILYENTTGNEGLAKAGSGDALAGIIASIFAQLLKRQSKDSQAAKALKAAALGVYLHGKAADEAAKKTGKIALMASDVILVLPKTLRSIFG